ncbi:galectin-5-like [Mercenaria mercenaria]|uniref:galectin-5-like n=1 Tax=Mercenaria mercenaria TaxID=6596 RepID=UPI00234EB6FC|nr:galectin-5-like [Mercenaria mercenaria]
MVEYPGATSCQGLCGLKIFNPPVPVTQNIGTLHPGKMIFISGTPNPDCPGFSNNAKSGNENAFHFDVRFSFGNDTNVIVRNAKQDTKWGTPEETLSSSFPFCRGNSFEIIILVELSCYKVAVNNQHLVEFNHRFPLNKVDLLRNRGDVKISMVRIQG